jgi:DNA-binding MarR family transcriptional regulator
LNVIEAGKYGGYNRTQYSDYELYKRMKTNKDYDRGVVLPDIELCSLLERARFGISRLRELELAQFDLTIEQSSILYAIRHMGKALTVKELEDMTMRQHHSISTLMNRMIKAGWVCKEDGQTGKKFRIVMTPEGEKLLDKLTIVSLELTFSRLTTQERRHFTEYLTKLLTRARDLLGISYKPPFIRYLDRVGSAKISHKQSNDIAALSDVDLWWLLDRTRFAVFRLLELEMAQFGMTVEQSSIMYIIRNRGGSVTTKELEDVTMRQHHSISTLINRMMTAGIITKEKGKSVTNNKIVMTKTGKDLFRRMTTNSVEMTFSSLESTEKGRLTVIMAKLLSRSRDLLGISYKPPFLRYLDDGVVE